MKSENNGIYTYEGHDYVLKYGHTVESARILLSAMERSGHLSDTMFYKMSKLMSRQGISVNDAIGMKNETILKLSRIDGVGAACIDVLCELQQADTQQKSATELICDAAAEICGFNKEDEMAEDSPFTPRLACEMARDENVANEEHETTKATTGEQKEIVVTYGDIRIKLSSNGSDMTIRFSDGTITIL